MNRNYANHCKLKKTLVRKKGVGYGVQSTWTIKDKVGQVVETAVSHTYTTMCGSLNF
jgi:hypothetical protein